MGTICAPGRARSPDPDRFRRPPDKDHGINLHGQGQRFHRRDPWVGLGELQLRDRGHSQAPVVPALPVTVFAGSGETSRWRRRPAPMSCHGPTAPNPRGKRPPPLARGFAPRRQAVHELGGYDPKCPSDRFRRGQACVRFPELDLADHGEPQARPPGEFALAPAAAFQPPLMFRPVAPIRLRRTMNRLLWIVRSTVDKSIELSRAR